jgi:hypothetical protein
MIAGRLAGIPSARHRHLLADELAPGRRQVSTVRAIALLHGDADLVPSKIDLLRAWFPGRSWAAGAAGSELEAVGTYRFDDPYGEVGIETHLLQSADGHVFQVALTYRGAALETAELITTMEHSVLGRRWVYDACTDEVYARALVTTMITGGRQADLQVDSGGRQKTFESKVRVRGSGAPRNAVPAIEGVSRRDEGSITVLSVGELEVVVRRSLHVEAGTDAAYSLTGSWPGQDVPTLLAMIRTG